MRTRIFHISDLHMNKGWHEQQGVVLDAFFDDIKPRVNESNEPFLVFSGDLVQAGSSQEMYAEFTRHFGTLLSMFPDKGRRICCSGNHDVNRDYIEKNIFVLEAITSKGSSETTFNTLLESDSFSKLIRPKFDDFDSFQQLHFGTVASGDYFFGDFNEFNDIGVYVLNSALLSFGGR